MPGPLKRSHFHESNSGDLLLFALQKHQKRGKNTDYPGHDCPTAHIIVKKNFCH